MSELTVNLDVKQLDFNIETVEEHLRPLLESLPTAYYQSHAGIVTQQQFEAINDLINLQMSIATEMLLQVSCSRFVDDPERLLQGMAKYQTELLERGRDICEFYKKEKRDGLDS